MQNFPLVVFLATTTVFGARPFLNEPSTGIDEAGILPQDGSLPRLSSMTGLPDFEWAARKTVDIESYTQVQYGAAGEWSYRNNLEVFYRFRFRPRVMIDIMNVESSLETSILGFNFSAPFFISPCANAGVISPVAERGLVEGAGNEGILYMPAQTSDLSMSEIGNARVTPDQVLFQQVNVLNNTAAYVKLFREIEQMGAKAIVITVDSAGDRARQRAMRYLPDVNLDSVQRYTYMTWDYYRELQSLTPLPIIPKEIQTVEDARRAVEVGAPAIFLSNHGGRALDSSPSPMEIAMEIFQEDPEVFKQVEVYADGGIRYGTDALKLLALGVRAVGLGRPFLYANVYGTEGVMRAIQLLKREIATEAALIGVDNLKTINSTFLKLTPNCWFS